MKPPMLAIALFLAGCAGQPQSPQATASVTPGEGRPGDSVRIEAQGFPPNHDVIIGSGVPSGERVDRPAFTRLAQLQSDGEGNVTADVVVPTDTSGSGEIVFVVTTEGSEIEARSAPFRLLPAASVDTLTITGVVTAEGVECPAVRTEDGRLYTIAGGDRSLLKEGSRVRVTGTVARMSICMQGTTLDASTIEPLP